MPSTAISLSASVPEAENKIKISYRSAKTTDVPAISGLLNSVFEDDKGEEMGDIADTTTNSNGSDADNNTFMWDSLTEKSDEPRLSPEQQLELIESQLSKRMIDSKKEDSLPHFFVVATIPGDSTDKNQ